MKTHRSTLARNRAWMSTIALVAAMHLGGSALAQANSRPPERLTYQGFIAGSDGVALGNSAPKNYDVVFRIFDSEGSTTPLWGEQQTVTVDKGYFSVLLGEGAAVSGIPNAGISLSSLFNSATASERWVSFTVKGIGTGGADAEILPRVRMMSLPYAFLANRALNANAADTATTAVSASKLIQSGGADLLAAAGDNLSMSGNLLINQGKLLMLGVGTPGKEASAGIIGYRYATQDSLELIGAGSQASQRKITFFNEGGATFHGSITLNGGLVATGDVEANNSKANMMWVKDTGILTFGYGRSKQFFYNGSIMYASGLLANGEDTLLIQGGGNNTATRSVLVYADGGFQLHGPLLMPGNRHLNFGYGVAGKDPAAGNIGYQLYSSGLDIVGAGNSGNDRQVTFHAQGGTRFIGKVSINTDILTGYPLYVAGFANNNSYAPGWFQVGVGTAQTANWDVGVYVDRKIMGNAFVTISDARVKDIVGVSDSNKDLNRLMQVRVTDYKMKDPSAGGGRTMKKVIAQELEQVYPEAVGRSRGVIPDIRAEAKVSEGWLVMKTDLKKGDKIRVQTDSSQEMMREVLEVGDGRLRIDMKDVSGRVFVYGREVDDFRSVDYEALTMLNVSATQELARRLETVSKENRELGEKVRALEAALAASEERARQSGKLQARLELLEQAVLGAKATPARAGVPEAVQPRDQGVALRK